MLVKVGVDTIKYITIFFFCSFGFGLCYMGLFPEIYNFSQSSLTAFSMFDFAVGNFNQTIFDDSPYEHVGKILTVIFVVITLIIIFNLLIARMADTYAKIDEKAFYQWAKAMAKNGRSLCSCKNDLHFLCCHLLSTSFPHWFILFTFGAYVELEKGYLKVFLPRKD